MFQKNCLLTELAASKGLRLSTPLTLDGHTYVLRRLVEGRLEICPVFSSDDLNEIARYIVNAPVCQVAMERQASKHAGLCQEIPLNGGQEEFHTCVLGMATLDNLADLTSPQTRVALDKEYEELAKEVRSAPTSVEDGVRVRHVPSGTVPLYEKYPPYVTEYPAPPRDMNNDEPGGNA
jgi:hypothetical protein